MKDIFHKAKTRGNKERQQQQQYMKKQEETYKKQQITVDQL